MVTEDLHVHTRYSTDSDAIMRESVEAAIKKGVKVIAFTEHMDLDYPEIYRKEYRSLIGESGKEAHPDFEERPIFTFDVDRYFEELSKVREEFKGRITILAGMEMGMRPGRPDLLKKYREIIDSYKFDVVLGSLHLVDDRDPYHPHEWEGKSAEEMIDRYFSQLLQCVEEYDCFTSLAHIDYIARYIPEDKLTVSRAEYFPSIYEKHKDKIDRILKIIIERGQALEINTKGLFNGLNHVHPSEPIMSRYLELGGTKLTHGTDAHFSKYVGEGLNGF